MGHPITVLPEPKKGQFAMDNSCPKMKDRSPIMKIQYTVAKRITAKQCGAKNLSAPQFRMILLSAVEARCAWRASTAPA